METVDCIDLSERMQALYDKLPDFDKLLDQLCDQAGYKQCSHILIGSSFCSQYFLSLKLQQIEALAAVCRRRNIKMSLVLPVFTEKYLIKGKEKIEELSRWFKEDIDEVVVNDYGMMVYIHEHYGEKVRLFMGRLFMKDYREPRYPEYFNSVCYPKVFTPYLSELIKRYEIRGMLFDATHKAMDFSERPEGMVIGIYEPYTYITMGQICELGAVHQPVHKKFRPNGSCQQECLSQEMHYFMEDGRRWLRIGRTIYFENRDVQIRGIESCRRIYCPFDKEEDK